MTEIVVREPAAPDEIFAPGAWDANVGKLIPVHTPGGTRYGQILEVRDAPDGKFVDLTLRLIQGDLGFITEPDLYGPCEADDECEGADAE